LYKLGQKKSTDYAMDPDFTAPFFQRTDSRWKHTDRFNFAVSMSLGMPTGMVTTKRLKSNKHHIIDGRQRKRSIQSILNPYELAETLQSQFPLNKGASLVEWRERIGNHISGWFSSFSEGEVTKEVEGIWKGYFDQHKAKKPGTANKETIISMKEEFSSLGITLKEKTKKGVIEEAVKGKIGDGLSLTNEQKKAIRPLYDFAIACCGNRKHSPKDHIDQVLKSIGYVDLKTWPKGGPYLDHKPFYWVTSTKGGRPECKASVFFNHPELGLFHWIWEQYETKKRSDDFSDYLKFLSGKADSNIELTQAIAQFGSPTINYFSLIIKASYHIIDSMADADLAWCSLEKKTTVSESMKIFQLINDSGHKLTTFELLASWPTWIETVVPTKEKGSKKWKKIWTYVDDTYTEKGTDLKPPEMGLTKWDLVSIITDVEADGIDHAITWG